MLPSMSENCNTSERADKPASTATVASLASESLSFFIASHFRGIVPGGRTRCHPATAASTVAASPSIDGDHFSPTRHFRPRAVGHLDLLALSLRFSALVSLAPPSSHFELPGAPRWRFCTMRLLVTIATQVRNLLARLPLVEPAECPKFDPCV